MSKKPNNADADILAIRPPNAGEEIREQRLECDRKIISRDEESKYVFVYCEVKTGDGYKVENLFPEERIEYVLKRFGLDYERPIEDPKIAIGDNIFMKILIAKNKKRNTDGKAIFIGLDDVISFIKERFGYYKEDKYPSRMFFNSALIQFLIHEAKHENKRQ